MKIALCGSLNFAAEILKIKDQLESKGYEVLLPQSIINFSLGASKLKEDMKNYMKMKPFYTKEHFKKITESDAILVVNEKKHYIENYIGGATFAEIMLAFHYNKKIFFLNPIPTDEKLSIIEDELKGVDPIILNRDLDLIK